MQTMHNNHVIHHVDIIVRAEGFKESLSCSLCIIIMQFVRLSNMLINLKGVLGGWKLKGSFYACELCI